MRLKLNKTVVECIILAVLSGILCILLFCVFDVFERTRPDKNAIEAAGDSANDGRITVDGQLYLHKKRLETILVIGIDKYLDQTKSESYNNNQQADFLMLVCLDHSAKTYSILNINRDTMADIRILDVKGETAGSFKGQLALSHTYGTGANESCRNTVKAVSDLLYGVNIDHYMSFTLDTIEKFNDLCGGVEVTLQEDFSSFDPKMTKGKTLTLKGEQAMLFVRGRQGVGDSSNIARMERQKQYVYGLRDNILEKSETDEGFVLKTFSQVLGYTVSDYSLSQLNNLYVKTDGYTDSGYYTIEGETVKGEEFMEFYPDEEALRKLTLELFYTPVNS